MDVQMVSGRKRPNQCARAPDAASRSLSLSKGPLP